MAFGIPVTPSLFEQAFGAAATPPINPFQTLPPPTQEARPFPTAFLPPLEDPLAVPPRLERQQAIGIVDDDDDDDDDDDTAPPVLRRQAAGDYPEREFQEGRSHWVKLLTEICEHYVVGVDSTAHQRYILTDAAAINTIADHMRTAVVGTVYARKGMLIVNTLTEYASPSWCGSSGLRYATLKHIIQLLETA